MEVGSRSGLGDDDSMVMLGGDSSSPYNGFSHLAGDPESTRGQGLGQGLGSGLGSDYSGEVNEDSVVVKVVTKHPPKSSSSSNSNSKMQSPKQSPKATRRKSIGGSDPQKRPASYAYNNKNSPLYDNHRYRHPLPLTRYNNRIPVIHPINAPYQHTHQHTSNTPCNTPTNTSYH